MNLNTAVETIDIVDDVELLAILGVSAPPSPATTVPIVLDWDDMPELSEEDEDDEEEQVNNKRKFDDEEEDIFAEFDFVEVSIEPVQKKQKTLLIQQPFVSEDDNLLEHTEVLNEEDIRLALDLISSST